MWQRSGQRQEWRLRIGLFLVGMALLAACGAPASPGPAAQGSTGGGATEAVPAAAGAGEKAPGTDKPIPKQPRPFEGFSAPSWQGTNVLTGEPISSADLQGKVVYLNFFATWCPPCRVEMPDMEQLAREAGSNVAVIAIGTDPSEGPEELAEFARALGITFPVVYDGAQAARSYLVSGIPTSLFVGPDGVVRARVTGMLDLAAMRQLAAEAGAGGTGSE